METASVWVGSKSVESSATDLQGSQRMQEAAAVNCSIFCRRQGGLVWTRKKLPLQSVAPPGL
uniref:Uncharacterized protein n=1 Tax=Anguilla anguilla TaxID=7936 RepID=A0A0E9S9W4_ANGAN